MGKRGENGGKTQGYVRAEIMASLEIIKEKEGRRIVVNEGAKDVK